MDQMTVEKAALAAVEPKYANKFYISCGKDGMIRIAFADQKDEGLPVNIHSEAIMSMAGFLVLHSLMNQVMQNQAKQAEEPKPPEREKLN